MVVGNHEFLGNLLEKVLDLVEQLNDCTVAKNHVLVSYLRFQKGGVEEALSKRRDIFRIIFLFLR